MKAEIPRVMPVDDDAGPDAVRPRANVREQTVAQATMKTIAATLLCQASGDEEHVFAPLDQARRAFERDYLVRILKMTRGNVTHAARLAGRNRTEFYRLLERHALQPSMFKQAS